MFEKKIKSTKSNVYKINNLYVQFIMYQFSAQSKINLKLL